jgi:hypothetical protein
MVYKEIYTNVDEITEIVLKYFIYILHKDSKICPGGRIIKKVVENTAQYISILLEYKIPIDREKIKKYINEVFNQNITKVEKQSVKKRSNITKNESSSL